MTFEQWLADIRENTDIWVQGVGTESFLSREWTTGGMTGGSCWGGKVEYPVEPDREPEFDTLDSLLERYGPDVKFLQYKRLLSLITVSNNSGGSDYYGNYYTKATKKIMLRAIYDYLTENDLLKVPESKEDWR